MIGYSGFISHEWFNSLGMDTHAHANTHTHNTYTHMLTDFPDKSNFKKPGEWVVPGLKGHISAPLVFTTIALEYKAKNLNVCIHIHCYVYLNNVAILLCVM